MIIQCPACSTKYVVPDTAIGVEGRTVRCAKCRHSWFQDGPVLERPAQVEPAFPPPPPPPPPPPSPIPPSPVPPPAAPVVERAEAEPRAAERESVPDEPAPTPTPVAEREPEPQPEPEPVEDRPPPVQEEPAPPPPPPVADPEDDYDDDYSQFDAEPPFRPRRNTLKMWTWAGVIFAALTAGTIFAVSYWGLPDWVPVEQPTFAASNDSLQLEFPQEEQERRRLPNGTEFFGASGRITNIGTDTLDVPTILIVLRDERDAIVYSWEVPPPQATIAPGESVAVNEAVTDIPPRAAYAEFGWAPN
ncbi:hypothetical protein BMF35_a0947 [Aurantiacibacter gangjinensis]|uniref:Uncharacterized protein n=2 Tax=Aurantiacibacter gangjinensis TaxID=502682 RepID=A0A0G9MR30_9SPHN|nr:zinc-ribbon domain-containing protein [Aurantiacibacter gangjinensis]APE27776.1 hypothetical protein BMF35_a0947 [Aurantiacibacter gangjinensis]KLE31768.1 hypothetical protein AAW01_09705 [Aurantiacibacter gangjinensis]